MTAELTVLEVVGECHHVHGHHTSVGAVEHPFGCLLGVKGHFPASLEGEGIEEDKTGLVVERSRFQEVGDGAFKRKT